MNFHGRDKEIWELLQIFLAMPSALLARPLALVRPVAHQSQCQWDGLGWDGNAFHKATLNPGRISWDKLISQPPNPLVRNRRNELTWSAGHYRVFCAASLCYSRPERTWGWSRGSLIHHIYPYHSRSPAPPRQSGYSRPCKTKVQKRNHEKMSTTKLFYSVLNLEYILLISTREDAPSGSAFQLSAELCRQKCATPKNLNSTEMETLNFHFWMNGKDLI